MTITDLRTDMIGKWVGSYELWFEPGDPRTGSMTTMQAVAKDDGSVVALRYEWSFDDDDQKGVYLINEAGDVAFSDTFHYPGQVMPCVANGEADVIGTYDTDGQTWKWRTSFAMPSNDELVITAWNIGPDNDETLATKAQYKRL